MRVDQERRGSGEASHLGEPTGASSSAERSPALEHRDCRQELLDLLRANELGEARQVPPDEDLAPLVPEDHRPASGIEETRSGEAQALLAAQRPLHAPVVDIGVEGRLRLLGLLHLVEDRLGVREEPGIGLDLRLRERPLDHAAHVPPGEHPPGQSPLPRQGDGALRVAERVEPEPDATGQVQRGDGHRRQRQDREESRGHPPHPSPPTARPFPPSPEALPRGPSERWADHQEELGDEANGSAGESAEDQPAQPLGEARLATAYPEEQREHDQHHPEQRSLGEARCLELAELHHRLDLGDMEERVAQEVRAARIEEDAARHSSPAPVHPSRSRRRAAPCSRRSEGKEYPEEMAAHDPEPEHHPSVDVRPQREQDRHQGQLPPGAPGQVSNQHQTDSAISSRPSTSGRGVNRASDPTASARLTAAAQATLAPRALTARKRHGEGEAHDQAVPSSTAPAPPTMCTPWARKSKSQLLARKGGPAR